MQKTTDPMPLSSDAVPTQLLLKQTSTDSEPPGVDAVSEARRLGLDRAADLWPSALERAFRAAAMYAGALRHDEGTGCVFPPRFEPGTRYEEF